MARKIDVRPPVGIDDYAAVAHLAPAVRDLRAEAERIVPALEGRTVWMVNSTEFGGGVAEMLPGVIGLLRDLGVPTEWVVIESDRDAFFHLTKRIHNLIHGAGVPGFDADDRALFEEVNRDNAGLLLELLEPGDVLAVHDPQPMPLGRMVKDELDVRTLWRCHIGLDDADERTRSAWGFLEAWAPAYDRAVFSAPEYVPEMFEGRARVLHPAINPLDHKNRELSLHKMVGILANACLSTPPSPVLTAPYPEGARRLDPDGMFVAANAREEIGLLSRPIVTQVSRWDRLKGWRPLLDAFAELKRRVREDQVSRSPFHRRRLELVRLVLAGPDPASVEDDPEGREVLDELTEIYRGLRPDVQRDVAILSLPMEHRARNALMVNAIQRASSIVVQNSLREGFGLTVAEAMWKRVPVLSNTQACGPRQQVRDRVDGRMVEDPEDVDELTGALDRMLCESELRDEWARNAQRRVHDDFLVFSQVRGWLEVLEEMVVD